MRQLLLDPGYWEPRLEELTPHDPKVVRIPRTDLARPGVEVVELRSKSHDGKALRALLARSAFHRTTARVHLRTCNALTTCALDFTAVERGAADAVFPFPEEHRLEDRVLDVLIVARSICSVASVDCHAIELVHPRSAPSDEFRIVEAMRERGWV